MPGQLPRRVALIALACACSTGPIELQPVDAAPGVPESIVELGAFVELSGGADPFAGAVPDRTPCAPPAYVIEEDPAGVSTLEIRTDVCNYLTLQQPSRVAIERGDEVQILMWHNTLSTRQSAIAYAAIDICGERAWSVEVAIPSPARSFTPTWQANKDLPAGCPVLLHVHNHGANTWRFGALTRLAGDAIR